MSAPVFPSSSGTSEAFSPQDAWDELIHKDDRTSPKEYPDMCLIAFDELQDFMMRFASSPTPQIALTDGQLQAAALEAVQAANKVHADAYVDPSKKRIPMSATPQIAGEVRERELESVLREVRRYIDPDGDPTALTAAAMRKRVDAALSPQAQAGDHGDLIARCLATPSSLNDACRTMEEAAAALRCVAKRQPEPRWEYREASLFRDGVCVFHWAPFTAEQNRQIAELVNDANALPASPPAALPAGLSEQQRHAVEHARYQVQHASPDNPECCFDYELVLTLIQMIDRAYPVPSTEGNSHG